MGAFAVALIFLTVSIIIFFNAMMLGLKLEAGTAVSQIYINIQYGLAIILLCSAFILLGISETYRKINKIFKNLELLFSKKEVNANKAIQQLKEKITGHEDKNSPRIKCPKCNNHITIGNDFKEKFFCPYCGTKLTFD